MLKTEYYLEFAGIKKEDQEDFKKYVRENSNKENLGKDELRYFIEKYKNR